ncbi:MAG: energy-coupling factor transporter transmembrane component T family protein [Bryobacteraceae bacterium]
MNNQTSVIHRIDARIKLFLLLAFVISVALLRQLSFVQLAVSFLLLLSIAGAGRLPILRVLRLSLLAVPFVAVFSLLVYLSGDGQRAWAILGKSYLSAFSVLIAVSTTPLPQLLSAARLFHVPALLVEVTGLIYRYLLVLGGGGAANANGICRTGRKAGTARRPSFLRYGCRPLQPIVCKGSDD